jgi:DNA polymerase-1
MNRERLALPWLQNTFNRVWCVDFEFGPTSKGFALPKCMVAREFFNRTPALRLFRDQLPITSPFSPESLFVFFSAPAELSCFISLDWDFPRFILDLYAENLCEKNTIGEKLSDKSLISTLTRFGIDSIGHEEKTEMQNLAKREGDYSEEEKVALLDYCETDVVALVKLLPVMLPKIPRFLDFLPAQKNPGFSAALFRGRYMAAVARMNHTGCPIDVALYNEVMARRELILTHLVHSANEKYGVFDGLTFKTKKFAELIQSLKI